MGRPAAAAAAVRGAFRPVPFGFLGLWGIALGAVAGYSFLPEDPPHRAGLFLALQLLLGACSAVAFLRRKTPVAFGYVLVAALTLRAAAVPSELIFENDVFRYLWDARVAARGINPYAFAPAAPELKELQDDWIWPQIPFREVSTIYPPVAQAAFGLARLFFGESVEGLQCLMLLFDLCTLLLIYRLQSRFGTTTAAAAYALHPLAIKEFVQGAHVDALAVLLFTAAVALLLRHRNRLSMATFGAAALVKVFPFFALPTLYRRVGPTGVFITALVFAIPCALVALTGGHPFAGLAVFAQYWIFNPSIYDLVTRAVSLALAPEDAHRIARPALMLCIGVGSLLIARRVRAEDDRSLLTGVVASVTLLLLLSPAANPWYIAWLLPLSLLLRWPPGVVWSYVASLSYAYWAYESDLFWTRILEYAPVAVALLMWARAERAARQTGSAST